MKLTDMKRPAKTAKEADSPEEYVPDPYPYGLNVSLSEQEIAKLGLDPKTVNVGDKFVLEAQAVVTEVRQSQSERKKGQKKESANITLQLQKLAVEASDSYDASWKEATE